MKCVVLVNAYLRQAGMIRQARRDADELEKKGVKADIVKNGNLPCDVHENAITLAEKCDFVVNLDKDKYMPRMLEKQGVRVFNSAEAVELCDDKMLTCIALAGAGLHLPDTVPAPLCYYADAQADRAFLRRAAERLGYPVVVKKSYGSWGAEVRLAFNEAQLFAAAEEFRMAPHLYQRRVGTPGEDHRILVVGGWAVACMKRKNDGDFRSNIEAGGRGYAEEPPAGFAEAAQRCAEVLKLDYCGVDLLDEGGVPYVCEVNSNAMFNEAERVTGVNVAEAFAAHILRQMRA